MLISLAHLYFHTGSCLYYHISSNFSSFQLFVLWKNSPIFLLIIWQISLSIKCLGFFPICPCGNLQHSHFSGDSKGTAVDMICHAWRRGSSQITLRTCSNTDKRNALLPPAVQTLAISHRTSWLVSVWHRVGPSREGLSAIPGASTSHLRWFPSF